MEEADATAAQDPPCSAEVSHGQGQQGATSSQGTVLGRPPAPGHAKASALGPTQTRPRRFGEWSPLCSLPTPNSLCLISHLSLILGVLAVGAGWLICP